MNLSDSIKNLKNKIEDINNKVTKSIESSNLANAKAKDNETKVENVINTTDNNLKNINENMKKINIINDELYSIEDTFLKLTNTDYVGKTKNFIDVYPSKFMIFGGAIGNKFTGSAEDWDDSSQKALVKIKISNENETKNLVYKIPSTLKNIKNVAFDRLDLVNMKLYQKCDMLKLTGSESWERDTTVTHSKKNTIAFKMSTDGKGVLKPSNNEQEAIAVSNNDNFIVYSCNFLNENDMQCFCFTQGGLLKIQINKSSLATQDVNGFKTWLSTANLAIFFEKASESVTDITGEKIKLCPNATIEMTNAVKPSKVEIKYQGSVLKAFEELADVNSALDTKVDKIDGKGLSTNDYTTEEKTKVSKIVTNGNGTAFLASDGTYKKVSSSASSAVAERKFKPVFGFDTYWGEIRDTKGNKNQVDLATIKKQIDQCEEMKVDKIICTLHIAWNETTSSLVIAENTDSLLSAISYCADKNVTIDTVKVHMQLKGTSTSINNYVNNTIGMSTFKTKYKSMLTTICNLFKNTTVTRITILNEMWYITNSSLGHSTFINECLNIVKNAGYSTGLTMAGFTSNQKLADAVIQNIDTFYINVYPGISGSGSYITKQEAIEAFSQCDIDLWIEKLKKKYPNKKVVISEMGTNDYWECLAAPSSWDVTGATKTGGYAVDTYITAMMEFFIRNNVDIEELWWWYDLYYAPVKETLLNYLGGDR